jgi:hypothetical protein
MEQIYSSPELLPEQAEAIVHKLIDLLAYHGGLDNKAFSHLIFQLLTFFRKAFIQNQSIQCSSD